MREELLKKVSEPITGKLENDQEYCYALGQACNSIIKRIKINDSKKGPIINPILNAKNPEDLYKGNNQYILDNIKLNNLIAMVISYRADNIDKDIIMQGYLENNVA